MMDEHQKNIDFTTLARLVWNRHPLQSHYLHANHIIETLIEQSGRTLQERAPTFRHTLIKQIHDPRFPTYNANWIPQTRFVAAEGPNDLTLTHTPAPGCLARFFDNTLFNKTFPVHTILAIGQPGNNAHRGDFAPYFIKEHHHINHTNGDHAYTISSRQVQAPYHHFMLTVDNARGEQQSANLFWVPMDDLQPLPQDKNTLALLHEVYQRSSHETVLIHCAAGVGRTGTALLAFQLLNHFTPKDWRQDPTVISNQITAQLQDLRKIRPAFIDNERQLQSAIQCAYHLEVYHDSCSHCKS